MGRGPSKIHPEIAPLWKKRAGRGKPRRTRDAGVPRSSSDWPGAAVTPGACWFAGRLAEQGSGCRRAPWGPAPRADSPRCGGDPPPPRDAGRWALPIPALDAHRVDSGKLSPRVAGSLPYAPLTGVGDAERWLLAGESRPSSFQQGRRDGWMTAEDVLWSRDSTALSSAMAAPVLAARSSSGGRCRSSARSRWYVRRRGSPPGREVCSAEGDLGVEGWREGHRDASRSSRRLRAVTSWDGLQNKPCLDDTQQSGRR